MRYIELLLSSVVIVAIIQWLRGYRNDKNQYITGERKEWRVNIKEIVQKIAGADMKEIPSMLDGLRVNLNSYGYYQGDYPPEEFLDYMKDEHIWREIDNLESSIKEENYEEAEQHKKSLIMYLSLLLKFDWERSKKEVKMESHVIISIVAFAVSIIFFLLALHTPQEIASHLYDSVIEVMGFIVMYILAWAPYIVSESKEFRFQKWYKSLIPYTISAIILIGLYWIYLACLGNGKGIEKNIAFILVSISLGGAAVHAFRYSFYKEYDVKISTLLSENAIILYEDKTSSLIFRMLNFFRKYNINIYGQKRSSTNFDANAFIEKIWDEQVSAKKQARKILKKKEYLKHILKITIKSIIKRNNEQYDWKAWLRQHPEKWKSIVEYRRGDKSYHTIGADVKEWKKWIDLFRKGDSNAPGIWNESARCWEK